MRDYETIQAVMTLAETGHLVFSTLHTIGAAKTIDRIVDVFPPHKQEQIRTQLSGVLNAVVTQQLIPTANGNSRVAALEIMLADVYKRQILRNSEDYAQITYTGYQQGSSTTSQGTGETNPLTGQEITTDTVVLYYNFSLVLTLNGGAQ